MAIFIHLRARRAWLLAAAIAAMGWIPARGLAQASKAPLDVCERAAVGSVVPEPEDLRSQNGVLKVELTYRNLAGPNGSMRYCYLYKDGRQAPTLRLKPGDLLVLTLRNAVQLPAAADSQSAAMHMPMHMTVSHPCVSKPMPGVSKPISGAGQPTPGASEQRAGARSKMPRVSMQAGDASMQMADGDTNLHFHGLTVPPVCHQDDVLRTLIEPQGAPFEYRFQIPADEPPGLYWYHPHVHGMTSRQVLGGASGALIIEGIERANPQLARMRERVLIIRDQDLQNPNAVPAHDSGVPPPPVLRDAEGDILNTGMGGGKPAKDLTLNFVPVPYPDYPPAGMTVRAGEKQLWRVLNASAITYLDLQLLLDGKQQPLGVVALDGVPMGRYDSAESSRTGNTGGENRVLWMSHVALPPAGRAEFIVRELPEGAHALFVTRTVDTGPAGENDPTRPLATVVSTADAAEPRSALSSSPAPLPRPAAPPLASVTPARVRKLYFSEKAQDPNDPNSPTEFYLTVDGQTPKVYDPSSSAPNIVAHQGNVEDWVIENRTRELHAFHIHQIHFLLTEYDGVPMDEPFLRDTINVPYWDGGTPVYPSVKLRMDFRDPNVVGTFVYHCHLLEHEDGGMMGTIRVDPAEPKARAGKPVS